MKETTLYIFAGLPASGKSTLSKMLASHINAAYLRIDVLEQGLKDICKMEKVVGEGYRLSYLLAKSNLGIGNSVVADSVNPIKLSRDEWCEVATSVKTKFVNIEVICSDNLEHKKRVEGRINEVDNLKQPSWSDVINREYHEWDIERITIDTAGSTIDESFSLLLNKLSKKTDKAQ